MLNTLIVGASGYAGAELVAYVNRHPHMTITALTVSAQSNDAGKLVSDLHPQLKGIVDLPLQPMSDISEFSAGVDVVFLATAHEVSHDLAPQFLAAGCVVFDLSGRSALMTAPSMKNITVSLISILNCWSRRFTAWPSGASKS
jgi:N-acetyl-gamma-glutamyl-phosphate reductase